MSLEHHPNCLSECTPSKSLPKVLFLKDDDAMPRLLRLYLRQEFEVVSVHSRSDTFEALARTELCALIYYIPSFILEADEEFPAELASRGYHLPVVIVTGMITQGEVGGIWWHPDSVFPSTNVLAMIPLTPSVFWLEGIQTVLRAILAGESRRVQVPVSSSSSSP